MNHTPLSWIALKHTDNSFGIYTDDNKQSYIALVAHFNETNARLIAAAPDLLEACEEALRDLEKLHEYSFPIFCEGKCKTCRQTIPTLRSAIAKAKEQEDA